MCNALISVHGLKNELYSCVRACFGSWVNERVIFMCSALVQNHGLKHEVYSRVARFVRLMALKN